MASLGYYTQADRWSKMGVTSDNAQVLTSTFVPALASVQDDPERFRYCMASKMSRFTAYLMFPALIGLYGNGPSNLPYVVRR